MVLCGINPVSLMWSSLKIFFPTLVVHAFVWLYRLIANFLGHRLVNSLIHQVRSFSFINILNSKFIMRVVNQFEVFTSVLLRGMNYIMWGKGGAASSSNSSPKVYRIISRFEGPLSALSIVTLVFGLILMVSTDSYLAAWVGMEVNMLGFMCLLGIKSVLNMRVLVNYFVFQSLGSVMFLFGTVISLHCESSNISLLGNTLVHLGLLCKAGLFPFWFWVPSVVNSSSLFIGYLLLGVQKIGPLLLLGLWSPCTLFLYVVVFAMSVLGSLGGVIQNSYRDVLVYSSFVHSAWMLVCLMESQNLFLFYVGAYLVQLAFVFYYLWRSGASSMYSGKWSLMLASSVVSLGGLPPFAGFVVKLIVVLCVGDKLVLVFTLGGSIAAMYFYLKIVISSLVKKSGFCPLEDSDFVGLFLPFTIFLYAWVVLLGFMFW